MTSTSVHDWSDATYVGGMEFRVLGPLEVIENEVQLGLGGPKQITVLALLIANAGKQVLTDVLIDGVYGQDAPERAHRSIHTFISNLRGIVGDVEESGGTDISGPPIGRAASLVATDHRGQVLIAANTQAALGASGSPGFAMKSLRPHSISGLRGGEPVYQLEVGGKLVKRRSTDRWPIRRKQPRMRR